MASIPLFWSPTTAGVTHKASLFSGTLKGQLQQRWEPQQQRQQLLTRLHVSSPATTGGSSGESIFFDGGAHYVDLVANLVLGLSVVWLPLTLAAVSRAMYLRYRFTNLRVTVISGLTGQERSDFAYSVIKDVQVVPRFIGEWGDVVITLKDGSKVDLRSVPKFRDIAKYCLAMASKSS